MVTLQIPSPHPGFVIVIAYVFCKQRYHRVILGVDLELKYGAGVSSTNRTIQFQKLGMNVLSLL